MASTTKSATEIAPASSLSWAVAGAILGATVMWFLMSGLSLSPASSAGSSGGSRAAKSWPNSYDVDIHPDSSDEELMKSLGRKPKSSEHGASPSSEDDSDEEDGGDQAGAGASLSAFPSQANEECKLVLVVRTDLGMGKGKIAAQCSHATLACYKHLHAASAGGTHPVLKRWERLGQAKIAVQSPGGEDELLLLQAQAISLGLCARIIHDAGRTQIASGTATVLGVGPGPKSVVDQVTGGLKLL